jgi:hypothetical protein
LADIFLSYASQDRHRARELAVDLEKLGWVVWWDRELQAGKTFAGVIESEIKQARCVLVLWSKASVGSRWVRDEATEGLERSVLVPVLIDPVEPPMGFRSIQAADLIEYQGDQAAPGFRKLVADLSAALGQRAGQAPPPPIEPDDGEDVVDRLKWLRRLGPAAAAVAIVALGAWGVARYVGDFERRAAELEARQKSFEETRRRADEDAARKQTELDAKQRLIDERTRAAEAERARAAEEEADRRRVAQAEAARRAEDERRIAQAEAARKADEERRRAAPKAQPRPVAPPAPAPQVAVAPPAVPAAPAAEAPKVAAAVPASPRPAGSPLLPSPGDTWSYRYVDGFRRGEVARLIYRIDAVSEAGVGESLRVSNRPDYASHIVVAREPRFAGHAGLEYAPPDLAPYLQAFYRLDEGAPLPPVKRQLSADATIDMQLRVAGREQVTVPAGTFDAIKVVAEGRGNSFINRIPLHSIVTIWYAPAAKRFVKFDARTYERTLPQELSTFELVDYKLGK